MAKQERKEQPETNTDDTLANIPGFRDTSNVRTGTRCGMSGKRRIEIPKSSESQKEQEKQS